MSKPAAAKGSVRSFFVVPLAGAICIALLLFVSFRHRESAGQGTNESGTNESRTNESASSMRQPSTAERGRIQNVYGALPLAFEKNDGQADPAVQYAARANGYTLFLTPTDAVFSIHGPSSRRTSESTAGRPALRKIFSHVQGHDNSSAVVHMHLVNAKAPQKITASSKLPGKANYFIGSDPAKWRSGVPLYERISYENVYPGVSLAFHGEQRQVEFDLMVAPKANADAIALELTGAKSLKKDDAGDLVVSSSAGNIVLHRPVAYQTLNGKREFVNAGFVLSAGNRVRFELGLYDHTRDLVIDPSVAVAFSTYLGGTLEDDGLAIAVDSSGNAYVTGQTQSTNFPTTPSPYQATNAGQFDAFVTKIAAGGSSLVYSTYIGGAGNDSGNAIAVDANGNAFVAGGTSSLDFPVSASASQPNQGGATNAFILELNPAGNVLTYSTYLGGSSNDVAFGIAVGSSGNAYVAGQATSPNFPTKNPLQPYPGTTDNGFVTELSSNGGALVYSTYLNLGGTTGDTVDAIALDASGNAYVTGATSSSSFHTTTGAFQTTCGSCSGSTNAFVTVINAAGNGYVYSSFLGGNASDAGTSIAVDSANNAYVTGSTTSSNFPTKSALQGTFGGVTDAFVTKINPSGSAMVYSTYLGGNEFDAGGSIRVDSGGNVYVTGSTDSQPPSPFTGPNATQGTFGGGSSDAFVSEINAAGSKLLFSTYLGGSGNEDTSSDFGAIVVDPFGSVIYVTGNTASTNFPLQGTSLYTGSGTYGGGSTDAFVTEYTQPSYSITATTPAAVSPGSPASSTVTLTALNGYASPVNLSCTVSGTGSPLPACSASTFSVNPVTPTNGGAATTLTISTMGPTGAVVHKRRNYFALWLPIIGLGIVGMVFTFSPRSRRKTMLTILAISLAAGGFILMPACGGSNNGGGGGSCTTVPGAPTGLAASATTNTGTMLKWTASSVGASCSVSGYTVYQNGKSIGTPTTNSFSVTGLTAATKYSFTVAASDAAGLSPQSAAISVTTLSGATPAGTYTITITGTGTDSNATTESISIPLTVN